MFESFKRRPPTNLIDLDWEGILKLLSENDPNTDCFFMITVNKGKEDEYRTRFLTYREAKDIVQTALEKKKLRIPISPTL